MTFGDMLRQSMSCCVAYFWSETSATILWVLEKNRFDDVWKKAAGRSSQGLYMAIAPRTASPIIAPYSACFGAAGQTSPTFGEYPWIFGGSRRRSHVVKSCILGTRSGAQIIELLRDCFRQTWRRTSYFW